MKVNLTEDLQQKWAPVLTTEGVAPIADLHRRSVVATLLENTENALEEETRQTGVNQTLLGEAAPANQTGSEIDNFDPVMISLVRRTMPNLMAYDVCGVQAMTGPTQLIFAMRSRYGTQTGTEAFYNEANTQYASLTSGANTFGQKHVGGYPQDDINTYNTGTGMATANAEAIGTSGSPAIPEMAFSIEKVSVTAKSRTLKAEYTIELAQDLKAIHGLNAETELSNILTTEILAEINREVVRTILISAVPGAQADTTTAGIFDFDTDSNGRWMVEKFKGLLFQIEREANQIAKSTRRGKGNLIICSSDVASALQMTGMLDYTPALNSNNSLAVDDTGQTFAGILNGKFKVYIDPYATGNYLVVGYKGSNQFDAGLFYCPYVPLQMLRAVDQGSFQPKIGFKTRYGMVANPFAEGSNAGLGAITADTNVYYRRMLVNNIM
jgi:hypothetical protein